MGPEALKPRLIRDYIATVSGHLPASIAEELADGLTETYHSRLRDGQAPHLAARSAIAEFGESDLIIAEFTRQNPARRGARRLLTTGPLVGACWAAALITSHAQAWQIPVAVRLVLGVTLAAVIAVFAIAARGTRYQLSTWTALAGCTGITAIDISVITGVLVAAPAITWITIAAIAASTARITFSTRTLRTLLPR
jgi:hypothetical protein